MDSGAPVSSFSIPRFQYAASTRLLDAQQGPSRTWNGSSRCSITIVGEYDAVALSTLVDVDVPHESYFSSRGEIVNPWGGVEAMLTHAISTVYNVPSAHAPMMESVRDRKHRPRRRRPSHGR